MAEQAAVHSIPALRSWLSRVHEYRQQIEQSLASVQIEIRRGQDWIENQLSFWQKAIRDCEEDVVQAKQELASRKFPGWDDKMPDTTVQERNLRRAEARLEHAQEKAKKCRRWLSELPRLIDEQYRVAAHRLQVFVDGEFTQGIAQLDRQLQAAERYAGLTADFAPTPSTSSLPSNGGAS